MNFYLGQAPQEIPIYLCECRCQGEHKEVGEQPEGVHSLSTMWAPGIRLGSGTFICWAIPLAIKDLYLKKQESKVNSNGITSLPTNVHGRASGKHFPLASGSYSTPLLPSSVLLPLKNQKRCKLYVCECLLACMCSIFRAVPLKSRRWHWISPSPNWSYRVVRNMGARKGTWFFCKSSQCP